MDLGDYSVLDGFGTAEFFDNCGLDIQYDVTVTINTCTEGNITRTWTATDPSDNFPAVCSQTIFVEHVSDWVVEFPADVNAECIDGQLPEFGEPEIFFEECELIATSYEDAYFYIVPDACYKVIRTWTVINWCVFNDYGSDVWSEADFAECDLFMDWDGDGDFDCRTFRDGWNTSGTPGTPDGYIEYEQVIKVQDDEAPTFDVADQTVCIEESDCDTDVTLPTPDVLDCSTEITITVSSDLPNPGADQYSFSDVAPGVYSATYEVTDNCGNVSYDQISITVEDCKKPTPYCVNGLVIEMMSTQMVDIWAVDFDAGSFDNCPGDLQLSFSSDVTDIQRIFTCDELGQNLIQLWVTDAAGNQDYCETFVQVQDNMNFCPSTNIVAVAGLIHTEEDEGIENVNVDVNGGLATEVTSADGMYDFSLNAGGDYTITPMLDVDADNGVTTWDMVLVSRHILNVELLDTPYKIIAADANNSGAVTTLDLVAMRKVILLIEDNFPNNTSWRFIDEDHVFTDPQNPWSGPMFSEVISYNNLNVDDLAADFVGVKVGDVNNSAQANAQMAAEDRNKVGSFRIELDGTERLSGGDVHTIQFKAPAETLLGYQFTLNLHEDLELINILPGIAGEENFGTAKLDEGALTTSWDHAEAFNFEEGMVLFSLEVQAKNDVQLENAFTVSSRFTKAEAYNLLGAHLDIELYLEGAKPATMVLYQNVPNPFKGTTIIGFDLPEATSARLTISDLSGQIIRVIEGDFAQGFNQVEIGNLPATGVLYYQLETPNATATKKMIILE